jgi:hypothetical protein
MNTVIIDHYTNTIVPRKVVKYFDYNDREYCYSEEAVRYMEGLMASNQSFSVSFDQENETDQIRGRLLNSIFLDVGSR